MMKKVVFVVSALATAARAEDYDWTAITEDFISGYVRGLQAAPGGNNSTNATSAPAGVEVAKCDTWWTGAKCDTEMRASTTPANTFNYATSAGECAADQCVASDAAACCEKKAHTKDSKFSASLDIGLVATGTATAVNTALAAAGGASSAVATTMAAAIKTGLTAGDATDGTVVTCTSIAAADFTIPTGRRSLAEALVKITGKFSITGLTAKQAYVAKAAAGGDAQATTVIGSIGVILATKLADPATAAAFSVASGMDAAALLSFKNNIQYAAVTVVVTDASGAAVADLAALATAGGLTDAEVQAVKEAALGVTPASTDAPSSAFTAGAGFFTLASALVFSMF